MRGAFRGAVAVTGVALLVAACSSSPKKSAASQTTTTTQASTSTVTPSGASAAPVWLCHPGDSPDPCTSDLDATVVTASGTRSVQSASPAAGSPFDCFYVYPTVSSEKGPNADLTVQPAEVAAAKAQAARFSSVCRVWAPMYRQVTLSSLYTGGLAAINTAFDSLVSDWQYYLQHVNAGRPFILIGHSQGAAMLIRLIAEQIDSNPSVRQRLVTAILAGGNLQVPTGKTVGATFKNIPLCTSTSVAGCAIAYSSFGSQPPADSLFGRPGTGVSLQSLQFTMAGQQVACVNPAAIGGGTASLSPYLPQGGSVPWVTYPALYTASCESANGATWLQVNTVKAPGDTRPVVTASLGPTWGYHLYDVNLALGNLVTDVADLEVAHHP
jgi:hypothetical protein